MGSWRKEGWGLPGGVGMSQEGVELGPQKREGGRRAFQSGVTASTNWMRSCLTWRQFPFVEDFGEIENAD